MLKHFTLFIIMLMFPFLFGCSSTTAYKSPPPQYGSNTPLYGNKALPSFNTQTSSVAIQPLKTSQVVCATEWVACDVQPAGSLIQDIKRGNLTTFWKTACNSCDDNCGCIDGKASGDGFARWCESSTLCNSNDLYGAVTGKLRNGQYVAQNGKIIVTLHSTRGLFRGEIYNDGSYATGVMEQLGSNEKFLGLLDERGYYKSGALHIDNKVILANNFDGKKPLGRVLIGDANGNFSESECDINGCQVINKSHDDLISDLFNMLAGNKAQEIGARKALMLLGKEALLMHPVLRTFSFLSDAVDVFELAKNHIN